MKYDEYGRTSVVSLKDEVLILKAYNGESSEILDKSMQQLALLDFQTLKGVTIKDAVIYSPMQSPFLYYRSSENQWYDVKTFNELFSASVEPVAFYDEVTNSIVVKGLCYFGAPSAVTPKIFWDVINNEYTTEPTTILLGESVFKDDKMLFYFNVQQYDLGLVNHGVIELPEVTDNGNGTISIEEFTADFYDSDKSASKLRRFKVEAVENLALTDNSVNYVYVDRSDGIKKFAPTWMVTDSPLNVERGDRVPVFRVVREGTALTILDYDEYGFGLAAKLFFKEIILRGIERFSGLLLSTAATRISTISAGTAYFGAKRFAISNNIAGSSGQLYEYYKVAGVWTKSLVTSYDASYYDDGTNRQTLGNTKYVAKYFYIGIGSSSAYYLHGNQYNTANEALNEARPTPPALITARALYVGKIVIQKNAVNGTAYPREWDAPLRQTSSSDAASTVVNTAAFNKNLTSAEDTVQKALDKIDDLDFTSQISSQIGGRRQCIVTAKIDRDVANITRNNLATFTYGKPKFLEASSLNVTLKASYLEPFVGAFSAGNKEYYATYIADQSPANWQGLSANMRYWFYVEKTGSNPDVYEFKKTTNRPAYSFGIESLMSSDVSKCSQRSVVPLMFDNTQDGYTVSASSTLSGRQPYFAFDPSTTTLWQSNAVPSVGTPQTLTVQLPYPAIIDRFTLRCSADVNRAPKDFTIQGSNNGTAWTTLHTVTNSPTWTSRLKRMYVTTNTSQYKYYRVSITASMTSANVELNNFDLLEKLEFIFDISRMTMLYNNGGSLEQKVALFVGEVETGASAVSRLNQYVSQGIQVIDWFEVANSSKYVILNSIGCSPLAWQGAWTVDTQCGEWRPLFYQRSNDVTEAGHGCIVAADLERYKIYTGNEDVYSTLNGLGEANFYDAGVSAGFSYYSFIFDRGW